jgi:hypothetical protein
MRSQLLYAVLGTAGICVALASAQEAGQKTFASSMEACHALYTAVRSENEAALEAILGKGVMSPDKEAARLERHHFSEKYDQMHRLVQEPQGVMVLYVGAENWPFPVPLVSNNGKWFFDSEAGKEEIRYRRVGENEITAMEVCDRFSMAKKQGAQKVSTGDDITMFAAKLAGGSPGASQTFHGYNFRVGGGGNLLLVAYPAEYRTSGITTFLVTSDGAVYEKDLGNTTQQLAQQIKEKPASGWRAVQ